MNLALSRSLIQKFSLRTMSSEVSRTEPILNPEKKGYGYEGKYTKDKYINPLLTPPPRSPRTPEDFRNPEQLGHWYPLGFDWTNPKVDKHLMNELMFAMVTFGIFGMWLWSYGPDYKLRDWAKREAYFRTHKREALGLPLIDINVIPPERVHLPTEEELGDFPVHY